MNLKLLFATAGVLAAPAAAFAQSAPVAEVVVTASRLAASAPYSVETISPERLAAHDSVAGALSEQADLYVQAAGGRSGVASIFLRGADPNFTAVLLDGVPLNNPTNTRGGAVNVSEIAAAGLARVEIVSGPLSSLYGSGALAGAVNLVVPGGTAEPRFGLGLGAGTDEDYSAFLRWQGPLGGGYGASLTAQADDEGDATPGSSFASESLTGKLAPLDPEAGGRVIFRLAHTEARAFPESSGGARLATLRDLDYRDSREALIGASHPLVDDGPLRVDLSGSYLTRKDESTTPGVAPSAFDFMGLPEGADDTRYHRAIGQLTARYAGDGWQALGGLEIQEEDGKSEGRLVFFGFPMPTSFKLDRTTTSAFVEASRQTGGLTLDGGARVDSIDGLGEHATVRAGLNYELGGGLALRASAGTGFKAPSLYALSNPLVGNPDLSPEKSRAYEAGFVWTGEATRISFTGFRTRYAGLIDFDPGPPPRLVNRDVVISKGVSVSAAHSFSETLSATAQAQYVSTKDKATGDRLLNRPLWRTSESLVWKASDTVTLTARHGFVGSRLDSSIPTGVARLDGYHSVAFDAAWAFRPQTVARLVVDNALDDDHEDAVGFAAPGRRARILLTHSF